MICPSCGYLNLPGADWCQWCQLDLASIDLPAPHDRVERSLMLDPVSVLAPKPPIALPTDALLGLAVARMIDDGVGAIVVTDAAGGLVGILTERDVLNKAPLGPGYERLRVGDYMTRDPETVGVADTLAVALGKMAGGNYRHVPVLVANRPVGLIAVRDILAHINMLCRKPDG
jgi:CBS domain-containing protein